MPRTNLRDSVKPGMVKEGERAKIIARNTFKFTAPDGALVTRLHQTDIVRALPRGRYQLNSNGWRTVTTKDRMASAIGPYRIWANKGSWYVGDGNGESVPYYDLIILPDAFKHRSKADKAEAKEQKLRAAVRKFVRGMDKFETLPLPSQGDCWHCSMHVAEGADKGKTLGDATGDKSHILEHVKEGYLHGSLLVNAMRWAGYQDFGIQYHLTSKIGNRTSVKSALRRYLYRQLGLVS